jgi:hypothetical protein
VREECQVKERNEGVASMLARLYLERVGGILQADQEGFSNEDGYQILWQFDRDHIGPWKMAVLGSNSAWIAVQMDLANPKHKEAFLNGWVPEGVKLL